MLVRPLTLSAVTSLLGLCVTTSRRKEPLFLVAGDLL